MSTFDERENAFENKYAHDAEMLFKAEARRNKLLGMWAAGLMGKSDEDAAAYAREVIQADFEEAGDEDVYRKVSGDLGDRDDNPQQDGVADGRSQSAGHERSQGITESYIPNLI